MSEPRALAKHNCEVHGTHRPSIERSPGVYTVEKHHIHPLQYDGPDTPDNWVYVCPTGHTAIHELLRAYVKAGALVPWSVRRHYSSGERDYALQGWLRIVAADRAGYARSILEKAG